jgi:ribosomal protein L7/L12
MVPSNDPRLKDQLLALLADGRKIEAISIYREQTGVSLAEAKAAVEALNANREIPLPAGLDPAVEEEIVGLLQGAKKIKAIKVYRQHTEVGLKEAKDAVEAIAARNHIPTPSGCAGVVLLIVAVLVQSVVALLVCLGSTH